MFVSSEIAFLYSFNYGKRLAPTASEIVKFLKRAQDNDEVLGMQQLIGYPSSIEKCAPISAGVSCLAALPSEVRDLVPEPYCQLDTETVEQLYGQCMDPEDNVFDMKKFEHLCNEKVTDLGYSTGDTAWKERRKNHSPSKSLIDKINESHYWVILSKGVEPLSKPIKPPPPFSERLSELRPNNFIRVRQGRAFWEPRQRRGWSDRKNQSQQGQHQKSNSKNQDTEELLDQSKPDNFLSRFGSLDAIRYKDAYLRFQRKKKGAKKLTVGKSTEISVNTSLQVASNGKTEPAPGSEQKKKKIRKKDQFDVLDRLASYRLTPVPKERATTKDGQTAVACLKQLQDAGLIGVVDWTTTMPSESSYASFDPQAHEHVCLTIKKAKDREMNVLKDDILVYSQDRNVNYMSRQALKQHLATFAICDIVGPKVRWSELTYQELKSALTFKNVGSETTKQ